MNELGQVIEKLDRIERMVVDALAPKQPALTITEFAKRVGVHRNTIIKRIAAGKLRKEQGRLPASQLSKFLS
jgi:excisionase family DNA binding protein